MTPDVKPVTTIAMVRGLVLPDDARLHDLARAVVAYDDVADSSVTTKCGITVIGKGVRLLNWTPAREAPMVCPECRDLPPFWAD